MSDSSQDLLNAAEADILSTECLTALRELEPHALVQILIRSRRGADAVETGRGPDTMSGALETAGIRFGTGARLVRQLKDDLARGTQELRHLLPDAEPLWLADALAATVTVEQMAELGRRPDVRRIELQPMASPARAPVSADALANSEPSDELGHDRALGLDLEQEPETAPRIALLDTVAGVPDDRRLKTCAAFDRQGRPGGGVCDAPGDRSGRRWLDTLQDLVPGATFLPVQVFDGDTPQASFAQLVAGMQWALEQDVDLMVLDLGDEALDPVWHLPMLNCTLHGTSLVVAGCRPTGRRGHGGETWPIHLPLAGCYAEGPLRTDLQVSGAPLGKHGLKGSLAAATRTVAAVTLLQGSASHLRRRPDQIAGFLFGGAGRELQPDGTVELDANSALRAALTAA